MGTVINLESLRLDRKAINKIKNMQNAYNLQEDYELKKVSGLDFAPCAYCKNNGCHGACSVGR